MVNVFIDNIKVNVPKNSTVLQACDAVGIDIPRFCFHERLLIAGNCRMCLVEIEKSPKPVASCTYPVMEGMKVFTKTPLVKKAQESVLEFLLINHPLDCPICDQGGECDLQDQAMNFGSGSSRFYFKKRGVEDKECGPLIKTIMTRCIHCTRCVRFSTEIAGVGDLGTTGRGNKTEIGTYVQKLLSSELSGNIIDLCPVGALTSKPYNFKGRPWELKNTNTVDILDSTGSNIVLSVKDNSEVMRVLPRINDDINEEWISDKTRFSYDAFKRNRLNLPMFNKNFNKKENSYNFQTTNWEEIFYVLKNFISQKQQKVKELKVGGIVGKFNDIESIITLKKLINSLNGDLFSSKFFKTIDFLNNFTFNSSIRNIENSDICLLVGVNTRLDSAMLNLHLRKAVLQGNLKVFYIGPKLDLLFPVTHLGLDFNTFNNIIKGKHSFCKILLNAKNPSFILSDFFLQNNLSLIQSILVKNIKIHTLNWNGFNLLNIDSSSNNAFNIGLKSYNPSYISKLDVLFLLGNDELDNTLISDLQKNGTLVIYIGSHGDRSVYFSDVILPSSLFAEKKSKFLNLENNLQETRKGLSLSALIRDDWKILKGFFDYLNPNHKFSKIKNINGLYDAFVSEYNFLKKSSGILSNYGVVNLNNFSKFLNTEEVTNCVLKPSIKNFYIRDNITRSSKTMYQCSQNLKKSNF